MIPIITIINLILDFELFLLKLTKLKRCVSRFLNRVHFKNYTLCKFSHFPRDGIRHGHPCLWHCGCALDHQPCIITSTENLSELIKRILQGGFPIGFSERLTFSKMLQIWWISQTLRHVFSNSSHVDMYSMNDIHQLITIYWRISPGCYVGRPPGIRYETGWSGVGRYSRCFGSRCNRASRGTWPRGRWGWGSRRGRWETWEGWCRSVREGQREQSCKKRQAAPSFPFEINVLSENCLSTLKNDRDVCKNDIRKKV